MVSPHTVTRDIAQAGLMRVIGTAAFAPPCVALVQVLANSQDYRQPAVAVAVWLGVLGAAVWLVPKVRAGGLSAGQTAAAIAIALAAVVAVGLARQPRVMPGSVDLAILGTVWLLVLLVVSHSARVWLPAALTVFAAHSVLLLRAQGLNRLSLSELEAAAYIAAALLIAFAALRPTLAVHAGMAARQSSLASSSAAERAAADAIGQERRSRLALLEREALPLLRGIADGTLDATAVDVRDSCARHAAALRNSLTSRPPGADGLAAGLEPALRAAGERGVLVNVQVIGNPDTPPPRLARVLLETVDAVLGALPPHQVTLTVLAPGGALSSGDLNSSGPNGSALNNRDLIGGALNNRDLNSGHLNGSDVGGDDPEGNDVELYLIFDEPPQGIPDLSRSGLDLPAAARWHAALHAAETGGGYLEVSWRKDGAI